MKKHQSKQKNMKLKNSSYINVWKQEKTFEGINEYCMLKGCDSYFEVENQILEVVTNGGTTLH